MTIEFRRLLNDRFGEDGVQAPLESGGEAPLAQSDLSAPAALSALLGRSVCRRYRPDSVPGALLEVLLACAQSAPSKSDLQQFSIIVVEEDAGRGEIASWFPAMPWIAAAPVLLVFCADMRRNQRICEARGRPHANDNLDTFLNASMDATLALGAFMQAADFAGLGTCPISHVRNRLAEITALLHLPPGVFPVAGLCCGIPEAKAPMSMRLPPAVTVHRGRYGDGEMLEHVAAYDRRRHERQPVPPGKQRNADTYGHAEVCTWSDQVSRQLSLPEREGFAAFLGRHGFALA